MPRNCSPLVIGTNWEQQPLKPIQLRKLTLRVRIVIGIAFSAFISHIK